MNTLRAAPPNVIPISLEAGSPHLIKSTDSLVAAISFGNTRMIPAATRELVSSLAEYSSLAPDPKSVIHSALEQHASQLAPLLAASQKERAAFFLCMGEIIRETKAKDKVAVTPNLHSEIQPSRGSTVAALNGILHHLATTENDSALRWIRAAALRLLTHDKLTPVGSMMLALAEAKDPDIKAEAVRLLLTHLSFPLADRARDEIQAIHPHTGDLLISLCKETDVSYGKPAWLTQMPNLIKQWQLACAAAHVDSGITTEALMACSVGSSGPLQEWQIRSATSPGDPLTLAFFEAKLRGLVGR
jgi:hypothetical protein